MALTDRFKKQANAMAERRAQLAYERAQAISKEIIQSDQFQLALETGIDNMNVEVDKILKASCSAIFDPVADFMDTMRCKNIPEAYIRNCVHKFYDLINPTLSPDNVPEYEEMLSEVAQYMIEHPELYNSVRDMGGDQMMQGLDEKNQ